MTPKDKVKELIDKFNEYTVVSSIHYPSGKIMEDLTNAKLCVMILVNEMLDEYPGFCPEDSYEMVRHLYWLEVKKELEKQN